jgi:PKHD-type hydroxylase
MTLQLTDSSEYNGGDFYVKYFDNGKEKEHKIKDAKEKGTLIVFPSSLLHRVTPITKGTRKSLVCWTLGFPFK